MLTYAAQTWSITENNYKQLETTQRAIMIRSILGTRRIDKIKIETMYEKTKMQNIMIHIKQMKWRWAGHTIRLTDERWPKKITYK